MQRLKPALRASLLLLGAGLLTPAYAVTTTYVVTTLNPGAGSCDASQNCTTLNAALTAANALPASPGDDIRIEFLQTLSGDIIHNGATVRMLDTAFSSTRLNDYVGFGAYLHVNALRPLVLDFGNRVGATQHSDNEFAMLYIASNDVTVQNFQNDAKREATGGGFNDTAGIEGGATAIAVSGTNVTLRNGISADASTDAMEVCVSLLDGASNVLIEDFYCRGTALFGVYVDEDATVSNITLNRFETQDNVRSGDLWLSRGAAADDRTVVNGLTITNSEFRSSAVDSTLTLEANTSINGLSISGSRFLGTNIPAIRVLPGSGLGATNVSDNTATNTGYFFGTDVNVTHTGVLTISDNILTGNLSDAIFLQSPTSGTVIENNQFLNQRSGGFVGGVRIATGASGTNNVIRGNVFDQASPVTDPPATTNRLAIWMRANPNGAGGSGSTGWSILNNTVRNIFGADVGPIYNDGDGETIISGNTFGEGTRGLGLDDPAPENDDSFFVVNADSFSNGKIQTWRPTGAVFTGSTVRVAVGPVDPPRAGNAAPTTPVSIDVYYTASDKAEVYLGRIPGTHTEETVFEFTSNAAGGAVRSQITDAMGRSSQYSASVALQQALDGGADDDLDGLPNGAECLLNLLGIPLSCRDTDGDGTPDYLDTDDDNDGIPTRIECPTGSPCVDTDGDGTPNNQDLDSDADGITDTQECPTLACRDTDGDGAANYVDIDSDGDGLEDRTECPSGVPCNDEDANGVEDYLEKPGPLDVRGTGGSFGLWAVVGLAVVALLRRRILVPLAMLLGLSSAFNAQAGDANWASRFYGGAMAGALFTDFDDKALTRSLQAAGYDVTQATSNSDGLGYGLWLGYALTQNIGVELAYTTGADERVSFDGSVGGDLEGALQVASPFLEGYGDTYQVRARYHHVLSENWFLSPRVGVGLTQTRQTFKSRDQTARLSKDTFSWSVGSGVHYALSRDWSVGVSADYYRSASKNFYGVVAGTLEWRFPRAFEAKASPAKPLPLPPPEVVPVAIVPAATRLPPRPQAPAPAPVPAPSVITLDGVVFASNSAALTTASKAKLGEVAPALQKALKAEPTLRAEVTGHTDASGQEPRNVKLSQARAEAVTAYLAANGIDGAKLTAVGLGSAAPVASNDTPEGREMNRRVEMKLVRQ